MAVPDKDVTFHWRISRRSASFKFARQNQKLDLKDKRKAKENEIVTLSDAAT